MERKIFVVLIFVILALSLIAFGVSYSYFRDQAKVEGNTFSMADTWPSPPPPAPGQVVINEVYYDVDSAHQSAGTENHNEWIELYNAGPGAVDISGWKIEDNGPAASADVIPSTPPIPADTFVVITPDSSTWGYWPSIPSGAVKIVLTSTDKKIGNGLNNQGGRVILKDSGGNIIDAMSYGNDNSVWDPDCPDVATSHSLARSPKGYDTNQPSDFVDNPDPNPGTNPHPLEEEQEEDKGQPDANQDAKQEEGQTVDNEDNSENSDGQNQPPAGEPPSQPQNRTLLPEEGSEINE